jgi:altronate hydrolase
MTTATAPPLVLHGGDTVAILSEAARAGDRPLGSGVPLEGAVQRGHKIARAAIPKARQS